LDKVPLSAVPKDAPAQGDEQYDVIDGYFVDHLRDDEDDTANTDTGKRKKK
jgi:hypothetical protein